jgi:hypothetical protein
MKNEDNLVYEDEERDHHLKPMSVSDRAQKEKKWIQTRCLSKLPDLFDIFNFSPKERINSDVSSIFKPVSWMNQENRFKDRNIVSGKIIRLVGTEFLEGGKDKHSRTYLYIEMGEKVVFTSEISSNGTVMNTRFDVEPEEKLEELTIVLRREKQGLDRAENRGISKFENGAIVDEEMVKWYKSKIELRKYRLGILEIDRLALRRVPGMGSEGVI